MPHFRKTDDPKAANTGGIPSTADSALGRAMIDSALDFQATPPARQRPAAANRPARRRTDAISPGERRGISRELEDRAKANHDSPLESLGKAMSSPIIEAAEEGEKKR